MYAQGQGVPQDLVQAYMWLSLAISRYPASEAEDRNLASQNLAVIASEMTPAQLAEAQRLVRDWRSSEKETGVYERPN
jgi:TPR repeat protein